MKKVKQLRRELRYAKIATCATRNSIQHEIESAEESLNLYRSLGMDANTINAFTSYIKGLNKSLEIMEKYPVK